MELKQNSSLKYLLSLISAFFVIFLIVFLGPVNAANESISSSNSSSIQINYFNSENLEVVAEDYISDGIIDFKIVVDSTFENKTVSVNPRIVCINIPFDLKENYNKNIIFKNLVSEYNFKINVNDFDILIPTDNSCVFYVDLIDTVSLEKVTLSKAVIFRDIFSEGTYKKTVELNHGSDLFGFISKDFDKGLNKGFNSLNYNFRNTGETPIKAEMIVSIPALNIYSVEEFKINSNSESSIFVPLYVDEKVKSGKYPVRISYRINHADDLKVKYGYIVVK